MPERDDMRGERVELLVLCRVSTEGCPRMRNLRGRLCDYAEPIPGGNCAYCHLQLVQQDVVSRLNVGGHCF